MVGLAPLLCLDGSFETGVPGAAPSTLSVTSADSENREKFKVNTNEITIFFEVFFDLEVILLLYCISILRNTNNKLEFAFQVNCGQILP